MSKQWTKLDKKSHLAESKGLSRSILPNVWLEQTIGWWGWALKSGTNASERRGTNLPFLDHISPSLIGI